MELDAPIIRQDFQQLIRTLLFCGIRNTESFRSNSRFSNKTAFAHVAQLLTSSIGSVEVIGLRSIHPGKITVDGSPKRPAGYFALLFGFDRHVPAVLLKLVVKRIKIVSDLLSKLNRWVKTIAFKILNGELQVRI
jgi:hypothetical protein